MTSDYDALEQRQPNVHLLDIIEHCI